MTGLTLSVSGTGSPADISSLTLSANGVPVATASFSGTTATFSSGGSLPASSSVTYTVTANFDSGASGTYNFSAIAASGSNGQAAQFNGFSITGAIVTVAHATATATPSATTTRTPTLQPVTTPVVFPNPVSGGGTFGLNPALTSASSVRVDYFTVAFRKVNEIPPQNVQAGSVITLPLTDKWGNPLASGLYYIVVQSNRGRSILKLLVLR
jgi:hypothetical protein